jgi:SagB-type dehydrogenase family enzyme
MRTLLGSICPIAAYAAALFPLVVTIADAQQAPSTIRLPEPRHQGPMSLEAALWARHSTRSFTRDSVALADIGQLLWAAQGVNRPDGHRTAASAGATYALETYVVAERVPGLPAGTYRYRPAGHELERATADARLADLLATARQTWIADAAAVVVLTAVHERTARRYGERAQQYVPIEVGLAASNLYLQAAALGLGTTFVGSFSDSAVSRVLALPPGERPMALLPIGRPR